MSIGPAARRACGLLPTDPGVYRFRDGRGRVMYLGRATNLRSRTQSYWGDLGDRRHLARMVPQVAAVEAVVCASVHEAAWLERNLLERSLPRWNRTRGGQEVPVWLELVDEPAEPGLRLSHAADQHRETYGPYLGHERARLARRGLLRAWPLHLTGTRPNSSTRSLAAARGTGPEDRSAWAAELRAVLAGQPGALARHAEVMVAARDRAVANLGFETAGEIQAELAAVAWLVAPQRVTACSPAEFTVSGWADGVLVRFGAHDGRLDSWAVERRPGGAVPGPGETTDPAWREFAAVNAALAARLALAQPS